jgi:hypothetical protein
MDGRGASLVTAILVVSIGLALLAALFWLIKARRAGGGLSGVVRGRQPRLAVLDSAAVDTRRRLVLIRRDDVEHLLMIGGPSDIVVESRIAAPDIPAVENVATRPAPADAPVSQIPVSRPIPAPAPRLEPQASPVAAARPDAGTNAGTASGMATAVAATPPAPSPATTQSAGQFPAERFADTVPTTPSPSSSYSEFRAAEGRPATSARPTPTPTRDGIAGGNPFDEADFGAVLDAQLAQDLPAALAPVDAKPAATATGPAAARAGAADTASAPAIDPPAVRRDDEGTLQEEMAKLLADMAANRR